MIVPTMIADENDIILTSSKRKGVYECDVCRGDISQSPRIRCAVNEEFDICLDCFVSKLVNPSASSSSSANNNKKPTPLKHGYRVCDSTRFPVFPTARQWSTKAFVQNVAAASTTTTTTAPPLLSHATSSISMASNNNGSVSNTETEGEIVSTPQKKVTLETVNETTKESSMESSSEEEKVESAQEAPSKTSDTAMDVDTPMENTQESSSQKEHPKTLVPSDPMVVSTPSSTSAAASTTSTSGGYFFRADDPKLYWTVEEDLRLLEGIQNHGLGNWVEIAETVAGQGKTPKRCMERYLDDYLGRYGHILPMYTLIPHDDSTEASAAAVVEDSTGTDAAEGQDKDTTAEESNVGDSTTTAKPSSQGGDTASGKSATSTTIPAGNTMDASLASYMEDLPRSSKRRSTHFRSPGGSTVSGSNLASRKKYKVVPTETLEGYETYWPNPYCPSTRSTVVVPGTEVGRDQMYKAEQAYVKAISAAQSKKEVDAIHKEWAETKLNKPYGPSVLPPRPEDVETMSGAELAGFMPRRGDFDIEWDNDAEETIGDMEFLPTDSEEDRQLKLKVLAIYDAKLDKRESRKKFIISRKLWDYRRLHQDFEALPRDERDLVLRMRLFERFHTPQEHNIFIADILKAKRLRKEIAKLQMYRRIGIRTLVEAEKYELDKLRRQFHSKAASATNQGKEDSGSGTGASNKPDDATASTSLWRQYRTNDRRVRKSVNRGVSFGTKEKALTTDSAAFEAGATTNDPMDIDNNNSDPVMRPSEDASTTTTGPNQIDLTKKLPSARSALSQQEIELCEKVGLTHDQYRDIKRVLIQESLEAGLLDKEGAGSSRRSLIKMDTVRRGNLIDFFLRAGWVSTRLSHIARSLPHSSQPQS